MLLGNRSGLMAYAFYAIYNVVYLILTAWFFMYANTYLNSKLIPDSLRWKDGQIRDDFTAQCSAQGTIIVVEAAILGYLLWMLNRWFLSKVARSDNTMRIAKWSGVMYAIVTGIFIVLILYSCFM